LTLATERILRKTIWNRSYNQLLLKKTYPESPNHPNQKYRLTQAVEGLNKKNIRDNSLNLSSAMVSTWILPLLADSKFVG